jgi:hypothetical protein
MQSLKCDIKGQYNRSDVFIFDKKKEVTMIEVGITNPNLQEV